MSKTITTNIAKLRLCVGFLGEQQQHAWWQSSFFSSSSTAFLTPVFGKTSSLAQYYGVKEAATKVHDESIGIGSGVFHLFRLPESIERDLHRLFEDQEHKTVLKEIISDREHADKFLQDFASGDSSSEVGPVRVGSNNDLKKESAWKIVAQHYLNAFQGDKKILPYFSETKCNQSSSIQHSFKQV
jgi:hypothetical protein